METVGLELGKNLFRIAHLTKRGSSIAISSLQEEANVKLLDLDLSKKRIVTGLDPSDLLLKPLLIKLQRPRDLKKALPFQTQTLTSLPYEEALFIPRCVRKDQEGFHLLYFITLKEAVRAHLEKHAPFSLDPDLVSATPLALARFAEFLFPSLSSFYLLHIEQDRVLCLNIENHLPTKVMTFDSEENLQKGKGKNPLEMNDFFKQRIEHVFASFGAKEKLPLLLTGEKELVPASEDFWASSFSSTLSHVLPIPEKEGRFAIAIGLCLDALSPNPLSFRQQELTPKKHLSSLGKKIVFSLLFLLSLFVFLGIGGEFFFKKRRALFEKKIEELSQAEVGEKKSLSALEKILKKEGKDFPFYLQVPPASSVLYWLKAHPVFGKEAENKPLFELTNFHYELLEMPTLQDPQKPSIAHVEIEFVASDLFWARAFHESLLEESPFLDKKEVEWEALSENRYRASFYLKPLSLKDLYDAKNL